MPLSDFLDPDRVFHHHPFLTRDIMQRVASTNPFRSLLHNDHEDALRLAHFICITMTSINVHEYPENANPRDLLAYRTAVQQAFLEGRPIEFYSLWDSGTDSLWRPCKGTPLFTWHDNHYRVARPKLAGGRNKAGLTEEQVGVKDGWRLLTQAEHEPENRDLDAVQFFKSDKTWSHTGSWRTGQEDLRTQKPAGFFLPKKDRFFRYKDGLFAGIFCMCIDAADRTSYHFLDGRTEPGDGNVYASWGLADALYNVSRGHWIEFDGDLTPWRKAQPSHWTDKLPAPYAELARRRREEYLKTGQVPLMMDDTDVGSSFRWSATPEGAKFWGDVHDFLHGRCLGLPSIMSRASVGVKSSPVAAGHNPDSLTEDRVDVRNGWRLLSRGEVEHRRAQRERDLKAGVRWLTLTKNIQRWDPHTQSWDGRPYYGADLLCTFRTKFAPGHFLPKNLTVEGWLRQLPVGYRERALANVKPPQTRCSTLADALLSAFHWKHTAEGEDFWFDVYMRYFEPTVHKTLPALPKTLPGCCGNYATSCDCSKLDIKGDIDLVGRGKIYGAGVVESLMKDLKKQPAAFRPKVYTPWTLETIPLPCVLRPRDPKKGVNRYCVCLATPDGVYMGIRDEADGLGDSHFLATYAFLFKHFEVSLDHGKTWAPAGKEGL